MTRRDMNLETNIFIKFPRNEKLNFLSRVLLDRLQFLIKYVFKIYKKNFDIDLNYLILEIYCKSIVILEFNSIIYKEAIGDRLEAIIFYYIIAIIYFIIIIN